jgi:hypothetical protein
MCLMIFNLHINYPPLSCQKKTERTKDLPLEVVNVLGIWFRNEDRRAAKRGHHVFEAEHYFEAPT